MRTLFNTILLAAPAFAADLTFSSGANCTGKPLYGGIGLDDTVCYDLSPDDGDTGESVLLSKLGSSEVVTFYSDSKCQNPVEKFSSDTCFNLLGHLGSFQDIVATPVKLSNYQDLAMSSPYEIDLRFSDFFIGVSTPVTSHGLSIFAAVVACSAINGPDPIPIAACIAVPLASILAYVGHYFLKKAGQNAQSSIELRTGRFPGRSLENISDLNTQYMTSLIAGTETDNETYAAESVGFMSREADGVVHTRPIYELNTGAGGECHFSAFFDPDSGTFIHHMHSAAETRLAKRSAPYGYDTVRRESGGFDFSFCPFNNGKPANGYSGKDLSSLYNVAYDQLICYLDVNQLKDSTSILVDMYNEEGNLKGSVDIVPYKAAIWQNRLCAHQRKPASISNAR